METTMNRGGSHRRYSRGQKLERLQLQIQAADRARIERIADARGTSYSEVGARLIAMALPILERQVADEQAAATDAIATPA